MARLRGNASANKLTGTSGADVIEGLGGDDLLIGRGGADTLDGGSGTDIASYAESSSGVQVDLATGRGQGGEAAGDRLIGIERVIGSGKADVLRGGGGGDTLEGRGGNDQIEGGGGNDRLLGESGNDTILAGAGSDRVEGGDGNDTVVFQRSSGAGARGNYQGGAGSDLLRLELSAETAAGAGFQREYQAFLANAAPRGGSFTFQSLGLTVGGFERAEIAGGGGGPTDRPVTAAADAASVGEDTVGGVVVRVLGNDSLPDGLRAVMIAAPPALGTAAALADGTVRFQLGADFQDLRAGQTREVTFDYRVTDTDGDAATARVTVTVAGANDAPSAITLGGAGTVEENAAGAIVGALSVADPDAGDTHGLAVLDDPRFEVDAQGRLRLRDGVSLDFEAEPAVTVQVKATDAAGAEVVEELEVRVADLPDSGPIEGADVVLTNTTDGGPIRIQAEWLLANDPGGDRRRIVEVAAAGGDAAELGPEGSVVVFRPASAPFAEGSFTYQVGEGAGSPAASGPVPVGITAVGGRTVRGGGGAEILIDGDGGDTLLGGAGDDILSGGRGGDRLDGGGDDDLLLGGDGVDDLEGGAGADILNGGADNDTLAGGTGADVLSGGTGDDKLVGGAAADVLDGGAGLDSLEGGAGADRFLVANRSGTDTIADFLEGADGDVLDLTQLLTNVAAETGAGLAGHLQLSRSGADTMLAIDAGGQGGFATPSATVVFTGIDLLGAGSQAAAIDRLLAQGNLDAA